MRSKAKVKSWILWRICGQKRKLNLAYSVNSDYADPCLWSLIDIFVERWGQNKRLLLKQQTGELYCSARGYWIPRSEDRSLISCSGTSLAKVCSFYYLLFNGLVKVSKSCCIIVSLWKSSSESSTAIAVMSWLSRVSLYRIALHSCVAKKSFSNRKLRLWCRQELITFWECFSCSWKGICSRKMASTFFLAHFSECLLP